MALELWASGNHDARILATMIADPSLLDGRTLDAWAKDLDSYPLSDAFSKLAARTRQAKERFERWADATGEWVGRAAWLILAHIAQGADPLPDEFFEAQLHAIEREIHQRKNRVRDAMVAALIAIAMRNQALRRLSLDAATRIGPVDVDHGDTNCRTPDAVQYIEKIDAYRAARAKKPASKKKAASRK